MVRNEADIIESSVRHLLRQGLDGVIVVDNLSTDDTADVIRQLASEDPRVFPGFDGMEAFYQGRKVSYLVHLARQAGADWVVLFDADEYWFAQKEALADFLREQEASVRVVSAALFDAYPVVEGGLDLSDSSQVVRLESVSRSKKVAIRPNGWVWVDDGNHSALDLGSATVGGLYIAHIPHRSFEQFERKVLGGSRTIGLASELRPDIANHWKTAAESPAVRRRQWLQEVAGTEGDTVPLPSNWTTWTDRGARMMGDGQEKTGLS